jgi:hypothetical protein
VYIPSEEQGQTKERRAYGKGNGFDYRHSSHSVRQVILTAGSFPKRNLLAANFVCRDVDVFEVKNVRINSFL